MSKYFLALSLTLILLLASTSLALSQDQRTFQCEILKSYDHTDDGTLMELAKSKYGYEGGSKFAVDSREGTILGDKQSIYFEDVKSIAKDPQKMQGVTVLMGSPGVTNYIWINTVSDAKNGLRPFYWADGRFIHTGLCK